MAIRGESTLTKRAMQLNGVYLESLIPGYATLDVTGREMPEVESTTLTVGTHDGAIFKEKHYLPRNLTITFVIEGDNDSELHERLNVLNNILDVEQAQLIFRDEPAVFYIGTIDGTPEVSMSKGAVYGSFTFLCSDPFKYSVDEIVVEPDAIEENGYSTFIIDYNGNYPSYPRYQVNFYSASPKVEEPSEDDEIDEDAETEEEVISPGDQNESLGSKGTCGYVAFFDDNEDILQFGNPDSTGFVGTEDLSEVLVNQYFNTLGSFEQSISEKWLQNVGRVLDENYSQTGVVSISNSSYNERSEEVTGKLLIDKSGTSSVYNVTAKANTRKINSVKLYVTVKAKVKAEIPKKAGLMFSIAINGTEHTKKIKKVGDSKWKKGSTHSTTFSFSVSDIGSETDTLTGIRIAVNRFGSSGNAGKLSATTAKPLNIPTYLPPIKTTYYLSPADYGSTERSIFHGPTVTRTIPADSLSQLGSQNFIFSWAMKMSIGKYENDTEQKGAFTAFALDSSDNIVAGVVIEKKTAGKKGVLSFYAEGSKYGDSIDVDMSYNNKLGVISAQPAKTKADNEKSKKSKKKQSLINAIITDSPSAIAKDLTQAINAGINPDPIVVEKVDEDTKALEGSCSISKDGSELTFNVAEIKRVYTSSTISSKKIHKIMFGFYQYSAFPKLDWLGIRWAKFQKNKVSGIIPNPFSAGDILVADSSNGNVMLNGENRQDLGALGNDWEEMCLVPGVNQISTSYSDWANDINYRQCRRDEYDEDADYYILSGENWVLTTTPTESEFNTNYASYYFKESTAPTFKIIYREVYL